MALSHLAKHGLASQLYQRFFATRAASAAVKGIYVAPVTPFDSKGAVNPHPLARLLERNLKEGASGFYVGGSSGECFLLSENERIAVFEAASAFKTKTNLIAHVGAISTGEAIRYAQAAKQLGYQYLAATPPFYYGFSPELVANYYYDLSKSVNMPILVYNFPGNTNKPFNLDHPATQALFKSDAVFGIKHTNYDLSQMERIRALSPKLVIMNGYDETMLGGLALGAVGSIGSTFSFMLPHFMKIWNLYFQGKNTEALELQVKANNIMTGLCRVGLIPAVKYVLRTRQNIDVGDPRKPFEPLSVESQRYVDEILRNNLKND
jgi:N-acetylneuraminate lyase